MLGEANATAVPAELSGGAGVCSEDTRALTDGAKARQTGGGTAPPARRERKG